MLFKPAIDNKMGIYLFIYVYSLVPKHKKDATENYYTISVHMEYQKIDPAQLLEE